MTQYSDNRSRLIRIWTPDGYDSTDLQRYPVIYMHDGLNLFDTYTAFAGEWRIDETIGAMMDKGYEGAIVVGIDNGPERLNELTVDWPANSYDIVPDGEKYAQFIVDTVKPYIDSNYKNLSISRKHLYWWI
jgi:pullulanase